MKQGHPRSGPFGFLTPTLTVVLLTFLVCGCRPDLNLPVPSSKPLTSTDPLEFVVRIEPDAPLENAPRVLRAHVQWPNPIDKERVFLIRGEVSEYHLRQIARDDLTKTLTERIVPAIVWAEDERNVVIAPTMVLEPGQTYAVASGEPSKAVHFVVTKDRAVPLMKRMWPDAPSGFGIYCGETELPDVAMDMRLDPLGPGGRLSRGIAENAPGRRCLRFQAEGRWNGEGASSCLLPPMLEIPGLVGGVVQIEPTTFEPPGEVVNEIDPLECNDDEIPFGLGCAVVMDDRLGIRTPAADLLWGIAGSGIEMVTKSASKGKFLLKGFPPNTDIALEVVTIDSLGRTRRDSFTATTKPLSAHVVLNEVLANPVGPEPHQEWVEIYNDGQIATTLAGYRILDIGGDTVLPDVVLPAGQFALVVNESFVEDDEVDVGPPPEAMLVRVPALGKSGLSNSGELLRLVVPEGNTISRFPALPKPKAGNSVSRRTPDATDGVSSSFAITEPTPGLRNIVTDDP